MFGLIASGVHFGIHPRATFAVLGRDVVTWLPAAAAFGDLLLAVFCLLAFA